MQALALNRGNQANQQPTTAKSPSCYDDGMCTAISVTPLLQLPSMFIFIARKYRRALFPSVSAFLPQAPRLFPENVAFSDMNNA